MLDRAPFFGYKTFRFADYFTGDYDVALVAVHAAMFATGDACRLIFDTGNYIFNNQFTFPNDGGTLPIQYPIVWQGVGNDVDSPAALTKTPKGTNLIFNYNIVGGWLGIGAKIQTLGRGIWVTRNLNICAGDYVGAGDATPLVITTNTSLDMDTTVSLYGCSNKIQSSSVCDGLILGGLTTALGGSNNAAFQGYNTDIGGIFCARGIRSGVVTRTFCNGIPIKAKCWSDCGSSDANKGFIDIQGGLDNCTNLDINIPVCEMVNYIWAVTADKALFNRMWIGAYDGGVPALGVVKLSSNCAYNTVIPGIALTSTKPYLKDLASEASGYPRNVLISNQEFYRSTFMNIEAGTPGYPNKIRDTWYSNPLTSYIQQEGAAGGGKVFRILRGTTDPRAGAETYSIANDGVVNFGDSGSAQSGNVTVSAAGQAEYWNQGKRWGFNGRAGGQMGHNTGTGGSDYEARNFSFTLMDQTGARGTQWRNNIGGTGKPGFDFGAAGDVNLYRQGADILKTDDKLITVTGLGVGNSVVVGTLGTATRKMEVFDATGTSLGFVPIYT